MWPNAELTGRLSVIAGGLRLGIAEVLRVERLVPEAPKNQTGDLERRSDLLVLCRGEIPVSVQTEVLQGTVVIYSLSWFTVYMATFSVLPLS